MIILKIAEALNRPKKDEGGFTMIELIIVVAILAILAVIAIPLIGGQVHKARVAADKANVRMLEGQANIYAVEVEDVEDILEGTDWINKLAAAGYLKGETIGEEGNETTEAQIDHPFGDNYTYEINGNNKNGYTVTSTASELWGEE